MHRILNIRERLLFALLIETGKHDHFDVRMQLPDSPRQLRATHPRHSPVGDQHVEPAPFHKLQRRRSVLRLRNMVPFRL